MSLAGILRRITATIGLLTLAMCAAAVRADCGSTVYSYDDRVVVFACGKAGPELRVILLDDSSTLKVIGRIAMPSSREFDTAGHYKNFLMLVRWDKFEVYDLADPTHPAPAAKFDLRKQASLSGYDRIEQTADDRFLVLTSMGVVEVTAEGAPEKWTLKEIPANLEIQKKMAERPPEYRLVDQNESIVTLRQDGKFRYELGWRERSKPGEIFRRQYLRKVDLATKKDVSVLLLGERLETID
jgi:hypothetical protein